MQLLSRSYFTALASCLFSMLSFAETAGSLRNTVKKEVSTLIDTLAATTSSQHDHDDLARIDHFDLVNIEGMNAERDLIMLPNSNFTEVEYLHTYMDSKYKQLNESVQKNLFPDMFAGITFEYSSEYVMKLEYSIFNGPTKCKNCLVAIHKGTDCAKKPKRRYWKKSDTVPKNPWTKRNGAVLNTDSDGKGSGTMDEFSNGYTFDENLDHVVAIYDGHRLFAKNPMKRAKMIACGVLKKVV